MKTVDPYQYSGTVATTDRGAHVSAAKLGALAGLVWSLGLSVLFDSWRSISVVALLVAGPLVGAVVTRITSSTLVSVGRLGAIGLGLVLLPVCAGLCGCIVGFLGAPLAARSDFQPSDMLSQALVGGWYFMYCSVLPPFNFIIIPSFLLTVLWIQKKLRMRQPHA